MHVSEKEDGALKMCLRVLLCMFITHTASSSSLNTVQAIEQALRRHVLLHDQEQSPTSISWLLQCELQGTLELPSVTLPQPTILSPTQSLCGPNREGEYQMQTIPSFIHRGMGRWCSLNWVSA